MNFKVLFLIIVLGIVTFANCATQKLKPDVVIDHPKPTSDDFTELQTICIQDHPHPERSIYYDDAPVVITKVMPEYTEAMRKAAIQGTLYLEVHIRANGRIDSVEVRKTNNKGPVGVDKIAIATIKKWKFQPAKRKGKPVDCWAIVPIKFSPDK